MFKDNLKVARKKANMTQQELANKIGVSRSSLAMYERGLREPDLDLISSIANALNTTTTFLIEGKDSGIIGRASETSSIINEKLLSDIYKKLYGVAPTIENEETTTQEGERYSPAMQKIIDSLDGMNEDQLDKLLKIIETAKDVI